jgi:endonuclease/exonuclease/phosphatase family metal-dependent hydrolase
VSEARRHLDVRVATYNIHRCRGMDRRTMPSRIAEVIREMNADVVALQEVIGAGPSGTDQAEEIGAATGMGWVMHSVRVLRYHQFGNVVLSRYPIVHHGHYDLSWRTCEERACQRADLDLGDGAVLHFVHDHRITGPKIILGDFNEWLKGLATKTLSALFKSIDIAEHLKRKRTYPGIFPFLHLDHIYYEGDVAVRRLELVRTRKALMASDHLPLVADFRIGF